MASKVMSPTLSVVSPTLSCNAFFEATTHPYGRSVSQSVCRSRQRSCSLIDDNNDDRKHRRLASSGAGEARKLRRSRTVSESPYHHHYPEEMSCLDDASLDVADIERMIFEELAFILRQFDDNNEEETTSSEDEEGLDCVDGPKESIASAEDELEQLSDTLQQLADSYVTAVYADVNYSPVLQFDSLYKLPGMRTRDDAKAALSKLILMGGIVQAAKQEETGQLEQFDRLQSLVRDTAHSLNKYLQQTTRIPFVRRNRMSNSMDDAVAATMASLNQQVTNYLSCDDDRPCMQHGHDMHTAVRNQLILEALVVLIRKLAQLLKALKRLY